MQKKDTFRKPHLLQLNIYVYDGLKTSGIWTIKDSKLSLPLWYIHDVSKIKTET